MLALCDVFVSLSAIRGVFAVWCRNQRFDKEAGGGHAPNDANGELTLFVRMRSYHVADNMLEYYADREPKFPAIARLARCYLCIPSSNVASESLPWSLAGTASEDERSCLSGASRDADDDPAQLPGVREHEARARHAIKALSGPLRLQNKTRPNLG